MKAIWHVEDNPLSKEIRIRLDEEDEFVVTALNYSPENIYVQEVNVDGVKLDGAD